MLRPSPSHAPPIPTHDPDLGSICNAGERALFGLASSMGSRPAESTKPHVTLADGTILGDRRQMARKPSEKESMEAKRVAMQRDSLIRTALGPSPPTPALVGALGSPYRRPRPFDDARSIGCSMSHAWHLPQARALSSVPLSSRPLALPHLPHSASESSFNRTWPDKAVHRPVSVISSRHSGPPPPTPGEASTTGTFRGAFTGASHLSSAEIEMKFYEALAASPGAGRSPRHDSLARGVVTLPGPGPRPRTVTLNVALTVT